MNIANGVLALSIVLRVGFFFFGLYQDAFMKVKYTDIDYLVFSDAANYVYQGQSPYKRETYRYTPLLAWMLVPNSLGGYWYHFGKLLFVIGDIITGYFIMKLLQKVRKLDKFKTLIYSAVWLMNPMVITISTRGSSESLLTVMLMLTVYFLYQENLFVSALCMGLSIHFKLYPVIYLPAVLLYLTKGEEGFVKYPLLNLVNKKNLKYGLISILSLAALNCLMYVIYGEEFLYHTYIYHFIRLDHRHNFSVYNVALYYKSAYPEIETFVSKYLEKLAFLPQLSLCFMIIPFAFARKDLISCMFLQTFAFVTFNKVITSQYFIWFLIFLPHFLSGSQLVTRNGYIKGISALVFWVGSQACWLYFAYQLEFLGISTFDGGLISSSIFFFLTNCWILGLFIEDLSNVETS